MIDTWEVSPVICVSYTHTCMCACIHLKCACACACMSLSRFLSLRLRLHLRLRLFLCVRFTNTGMCTYRSSLEAHRLMCLMSAKESECLTSPSLTPYPFFARPCSPSATLALSPALCSVSFSVNRCGFLSETMRSGVRRLSRVDDRKRNQKSAVTIEGGETVRGVQGEGVYKKRVRILNANQKVLHAQLLANCAYDS